MRSWKFIALTALATLAMPAGAAPPILHAVPGAVALALTPGTSRLTDQAQVYVPKSVANPAPLIVVLRGSSQDPDDMFSMMKPEADRQGAIMLSLEPTDGKWTLKPGAAPGDADFGKDPAALDAALTALFAKAPVDPARTVILGYADGASYALSLGITNPKLFRGVVALSPGTAWLPSSVERAQKVFIMHGMRDEIYPFANTRDTIVPGLQSAGLQVKTRWLNAGHDIERRMIREGLDETLGAAR